jgi:hypothetical protein
MSRKKPGTSQADEASGSQRGPTTTAGAERAIYVRTTPLLKAVVKEAATRTQQSETWVLERLIEAFFLSSEEVRRDVLQGLLSLDAVSELIALTNWANHAFSLGHWTWSIQLYTRLAEECRKRIYGQWKPPNPEKPDEKMTRQEIEEAEQRRRVFAESSGLHLFSLYRLGYSWSEFGLALRRQALIVARNLPEAKTEDKAHGRTVRLIDDHFEAALDAGRQAFEVHDAIEALQPGNALIRYNGACCCSAQGMMLVESNLPYGRNRPTCVSELCAAVADGNPKAIEAAWAKLGELWRGLSIGDKAKREIDEWGRKAMAYLEGLRTPADPNSRIPWPDNEYFPHRTRDDPDMAFIKHDHEFKKEYRTWIEQFTDDWPPDDWLLKSYKEMPPSVRTVWRPRSG